MLANDTPSLSDLVARCPGCAQVTSHRTEGQYHRCTSCYRVHHLLANLR